MKTALHLPQSTVIPGLQTDIYPLHVGFRFSGAIFNYVLLPLLLCLGMMQEGVARESAAPSVIEIPVRIPLAPVFRAAEASVPRQAGDPRRWRTWHGIKIQFQAWRGPLYFRVHGQTAMVQAHIRYRVRAHKSVLKAIKLRGSCGVTEAPRQAVIGVLFHLSWGPDWSLRPEFRVLPTRFLDRCEMTIANIDVTPIIGEAFDRKLRDGLSAALETLIPSAKQIRTQAHQIWTRLQEPIRISDQDWLSLRPYGVALSPLTGGKDHLDGQLAVLLAPQWVQGPRPESRPGPPPPLGLFYPRSGGLNLRLFLDLDLADIGTRIGEALADRPLVFMGRQVGLDAVAVAGEDRSIVVYAELTGGLSGTLEVRAEPAFDPEHQVLKLEHLEFSYNGNDPSVSTLAELFHQAIRQAVEEAANDALAHRLGQWKGRLSMALDKLAPEHLKFDLSALRFRSVDITMEDNGIRIDGVASGPVGVQIL